MDILMATVYDKEHNSHYHIFSFNTSSSTHNHGNVPSYYVDCGWGDSHYHMCHLSLAGGHNHLFSGTSSTESATDLNHTHTFSVSTAASVYPHTHMIDPPNQTDGGGCAHECKYGCDTCSDTPHLHWYYGTTDSGGNSHSHTASGTTGIGVGTVYWHYHAISVTTGSGDSHTHGGSPSLNTDRCHYGHYHAHVGGVIPSVEHTHTISGNTDYAGEPPPAPTVRTYPSPVY